MRDEEKSARDEPFPGDAKSLGLVLPLAVDLLELEQMNFVATPI